MLRRSMQPYLRFVVVVAVAALPLCACSDDKPGADARPLDAHNESALDAPSDGGPDAPTGPPWVATLPPTASLATHRGLRVVRTIVHSHSISSHDACDGKPRLANDAPNEPCLQDLRAAVCATRIDALMLTEHIDSLSKRPYAELLVQRDDDTLIKKAGSW